MKRLPIGTRSLLCGAHQFALHPDNRATGDPAAMLRLNRAYEEARQALDMAR